MTLWAEQDALFLSPLITLGCLIFGVRYIERRFKKADPPPFTVHDLAPLPVALQSSPIKKDANDWGIKLAALLDEITEAGWVVLLDDAKDELTIVALRANSGKTAAIVRPTRDGKAWELA